MKVITGIARGVNIQTVEGMDVRPTTQKVKEGIFSSVQFDLPCARILDLFCGCGQMGIEALSRGAEFCVFVDNNRKSHDITKENLIKASLFKKARVVLMDCEAFLKTSSDIFDIAFLDPPYEQGMEILEQVLPLLEGKMSENGIILCEHDFRCIIPNELGKFTLKKQYKYGRIVISKFTA